MIDTRKPPPLKDAPDWWQRQIAKATSNDTEPPEMNSYAESIEILLHENEERLARQVRINGSLLDDLEALENRCKVAEDLNKVYVRMYLEMQQKYDDLAKSTVCCFADCTFDVGDCTCVDEDEFKPRHTLD